MGFQQISGYSNPVLIYYTPAAITVYGIQHFYWGNVQKVGNSARVATPPFCQPPKGFHSRVVHPNNRYYILKSSKKFHFIVNTKLCKSVCKIQRKEYCRIMQLSFMQKG